MRQTTHCTCARKENVVTSLSKCFGVVLSWDTIINTLTELRVVCSARVVRHSIIHAIQSAANYKPFSRAAIHPKMLIPYSPRQADLVPHNSFSLDAT